MDLETKKDIKIMVLQFLLALPVFLVIIDTFYIHYLFPFHIPKTLFWDIRHLGFGILICLWGLAIGDRISKKWILKNETKRNI